MLPLLVMAVSIVLARAAGAWEWLPIESWPAATRVGLAVMFLFTASAHFTPMKADLVRMVPSALPRPERLVAVTGVIEIAGAVGLLIPSTSRLAAYALMALLMGVIIGVVKTDRGFSQRNGLSTTGV